LSVPEIISSVLSDNGFTDFDVRLTDTYDHWNFCVQYQESDFDFISRLMEHEGIYYFFEHFDNRHVMVICDNASAHSIATNYAEIPHLPKSTGQRGTGDHLINWQFEKTVRSGKYVTKDFSFDKPQRDLLVNSSESFAGSYESKEVYEFPGGYTADNSGEMTRSYGIQLAMHAWRRSPRDMKWLKQAAMCGG
jgi:type VI secretion system secreted protein VgrG